MPELADFDLVIQVTRAAIERELLNTSIETDPDGAMMDSLWPPFVIRRDIALPGQTARLQLFVRTMEVRAVPGTAQLDVHMTFNDTSLEAPGNTVSMLAGVADLRVPMLFAAASGMPPTSQFALDFNTAASNLTLDEASRETLRKEFGAHLGALAETLLAHALNAAFQALGLQQLGFSFVIDPSQHSSDLMTLTAQPEVLWIDGETLALLGHHRLGGVGNPAKKTSGDLPPPPYPSFPNWSPALAMLSPFSFEQLVARPAVNAIARDHVAGPIRRQYIDEERAKHGNTGPATAEQAATADKRLAEWLAKPETIATIAGKIPAPYGQGRLDQQIPVPDPFRAATANVTYLGMTLGVGRIDMLARANAEVFCGSVHVSVPMWAQPTVNIWSQTVDLGPVTVGEPQSEVNADPICEAAIGVMSTYLLGGVLGAVAAMLGVAVAESIAESVLENMIGGGLAGEVGSTAGPALPTAIRWRELQIDPTALGLAGTWDGLPHDPRQFVPSVALEWNRTSTPSTTLPTDEGEFEVICPIGNASFPYKRRHWNTTIELSVDAEDVPAPLRWTPWYMEIAGQTLQLQPGTIDTPGQVVEFDPPNNERAEVRDHITIGVQQVNDSEGWRLDFRGEDGIIRVWVWTIVIDASGRQWPLRRQLTAAGQTIELTGEYVDFRARCNEAIVRIAEEKQLVEDVPVWEQVTNPEGMVANRIRDAVAGRHLGANEAIRDLLADDPQVAERMLRGIVKRL